MDCFASAWPQFAMVVMIVTMVYAALFIIARMLEIQKLEQVAKAEMQEALLGGFTVIIIAYVIFTLSQQVGFAMVQDFVSSYGTYVGTALPASSGTTCQDDPRSNFFFNQSSKLNGNIQGAFTSLFLAVSEASNNASIASRSSLSRSIAGSQPVGGSGTEGKGGVSGEVSASGSLITSLCRPLTLIPTMLNEIQGSTSRMLSVMSAQDALIEVAKLTYLSFFLVGIILRSINLTRGIGAFFISFSIALYLYPIFVILTEGYVIQFYADKMGMNLMTSSSAMGSTIADMSKFDQYKEIPGIAPFSSQYSYCKEDKVKSNLQSDLAKFRTEIVNGVEGKSGANVITIGALMLSLFLAQGFALLIVVSLTAGISKILGGDVGVFIIGQITRIGA